MKVVEVAAAEEVVATEAAAAPSDPPAGTDDDDVEGAAGARRNARRGRRVSRRARRLGGAQEEGRAEGLRAEADGVVGVDVDVVVVVDDGGVGPGVGPDVGTPRRRSRGFCRIPCRGARASRAPRPARSTRRGARGGRRGRVATDGRVPSSTGPVVGPAAIAAATALPATLLTRERLLELLVERAPLVVRHREPERRAAEV